MGAGAIVVVALIAAAVSATAVTAIKQTTGSGADNVNDAFGDWLKTFFISFAANSVGGAAGAAGEGASAGVDTGMYSGVGNNALENTISAELARDGIGTAAAQGAEAMAVEGLSDVGAMAPENIGQFESDILSSQAQQVMAEQPQSMFESSMNIFSDVVSGKTKGITKQIMDALGYDDRYDSLLSNTEYADATTETLSGDVSPEQQPDPFLEQRARGLQFGAQNPVTFSGKQKGLEEWLKEINDPMLAESFGYDYFEQPETFDTLGGSFSV